MKRYGLIGYPLGHSFSKKYFGDKFANENITDCSYELFPIAAIDQLPALLQQYPDLCGLNVTIPYKRDVFTYLTDTSQLPADLGACNCILIRDGELIGHNTDVAGFRLSLAPLLKPHQQKALILGNGGATAAVKHALNHLQIEYLIVGRRMEAGVDLLYKDIDGGLLSEYTIIINTTPLGTYPDTDRSPDIPYGAIGEAHLLFDLVYNPPVTRFMQLGTERGATVSNGYDMLVIQAEESWKIWQGLTRG
ncbi:MAG: shikimate dehydrogenase [Chitinophagaceae bacterium]|nr:MAG: shikimate dehydrogenase [Chitinophagaceae bacterium]